MAAELDKLAQAAQSRGLIAWHKGGEPKRSSFEKRVGQKLLLTGQIGSVGLDHEQGLRKQIILPVPYVFGENIMVGLRHI